MTEPIEFESDLTDEQIKKEYRPLMETMRAQLELVFDQGFSGVSIQDFMLDDLAIAAARVAVEICPDCHEQARPCSCERDE